jgi:hypothetical protein
MLITYVSFRPNTGAASAVTSAVMPVRLNIRWIVRSSGARARVLTAVYHARSERFVRNAPAPPAISDGCWINPPEQEETARVFAATGREAWQPEALGWNGDSVA